MTPLPFLILCLATWRTASLFCCEDGPLDAFLHFRQWAGRVRFFHDLLDCVWCCSIWTGAGWLGLYWAFGDFALWLAAIFAFSAVAIIIQRGFERTEKGNRWDG